MNIFETLAASAQNFHGITLQPVQVREVVGTVMNMQQVLMDTDQLLQRYVEKYGDDIITEFAEGVEAELVEEQDVLEVDGQSDGEVEVDSPTEEEE